MSEHAKVDPFAVEARGLVKRYPGVVALDRADLTLEGGSIHGLLGKNGAGKSTIIKVLAGVVSPDEGEVRIDGEKVSIPNSHAAAQLGFAFVHQELADVPNLSVAENVMLGLGYPKTAGFVRTRALRRRAAAALDRLEAGIDPAAPLARLSVAHRRLVMIARGIAAEARLFVLDEPTASLTETEIEHLHGVLRSLRDSGGGVLFVSHRLDEILSLTDTLTVMRDGAAVSEAKTADVDRHQVIEQITGNAVEVETRTPHFAPPEAETVLSVTGLTRPGAVEGVSFNVREGELLGLAGMVGSGRTELMRLVFGADRATAGEISVHGQKVKIRNPRDGLAAGIVLLPEDRKGQAAVLDFSVRKNITLSAMPKFRVLPGLPVPSQSRERRVSRELAKRLKIKISDIEQSARDLSGGNQQKMVLAKWLDSGADVFIFDEPTQGIDVEGKEEVYDLMSGLADRGKGVIFVSSEFPELIGNCGRILVMREGHLVAEMAGGDLTEEELVAACYGHDAKHGKEER
jgi:ABC-type sugar transport system ATPase subunit